MEPKFSVRTNMAIQKEKTLLNGLASPVALRTSPDSSFGPGCQDITLLPPEDAALLLLLYREPQAQVGERLLLVPCRRLWQHVSREQPPLGLRESLASEPLARSVFETEG